MMERIAAKKTGMMSRLWSKGERKYFAYRLARGMPESTRKKYARSMNTVVAAVLDHPLMNEVYSEVMGKVKAKELTRREAYSLISQVHGLTAGEIGMPDHVETLDYAFKTVASQKVPDPASTAIDRVHKSINGMNRGGNPIAFHLETKRKKSVLLIRGGKMMPVEGGKKLVITRRGKSILVKRNR